MKKFIGFVFAFILAFTAVLLPAAAASVATPDFEVTAHGVYMYNIDSETLIYEKNAHEPMVPASLTKIMTCILVLENTSDLDREMATYPHYVQDYLYNYQYVEGHGRVSTGGLMAGEELPMRELLYALMLPSANEAAMIIADHIGGSQEEFADMMNKRAKELGAVNTNFVNPNGLYDENHYTTPYDMFLITRHAMELPGFMEIVSTPSRSYGPTNRGQNLTWDTTNQMIVESSSYYYPPLKGIKTGTLPESGRCFVSTATRDGFTYLLVIMGAPLNDKEGSALPYNSSFTQTKDFYDWAFRSFKHKALLEQGKYLKEVPLKLSMEKDYLQLMTEERFSALVHTSVDASSVTKDYDLPEVVYAPIEKHDVIGTVTLSLGGETLGTVNLVAAESVSASTTLVALEKVRSVLRSFWFKFIVIFLILLILAYIVLMILRNRNRRGGYKPRRRI